MLHAIRKRYPRVELRAWARREAAVERILAATDLVDQASTNLGETVEGADLVVLAMPTGAMAETVSGIEFFGVDPGEVVVTDVGSVKLPVLMETAPLVEARGGSFVGSHPMAGSEKAGLEAADADLFEGAAVILTPDTRHATSPVVEKVAAFWRCLGAKIERMDAGDHDRLVAAISHLPHLTAAALVRTVLGESPESGMFCGGGFRDTTRISAGPPEMWSGILADNREAVVAVLDDLLHELSDWKEALDSLDRDQLRTFLSEARDLRKTI